MIRYARLNIVLGVSSVLLMAVPALFSVTPSGDGLVAPVLGRLPELCIHKRLTGRECPTCHLGRSVVLAAHADFAGSQAQHRGGLALYAWLLIHACARFALALRSAAARLWPVDVGLSLSSLLLATVAVLILSPL